MVFKNLLDKFLRFFFFISNLIITRTAFINAAVFSRFEPIEVDMDLFKKSWDRAEALSVGRDNCDLAFQVWHSPLVIFREIQSVLMNLFDYILCKKVKYI